ncbi:ABC transporter permease [Streptomyces sp. NBC_01217]|uniref:ABC transporter permease n=1 Tax=Streptomyces sp. NBC_01217 TaxID=2903779 RepID=UPI002E10AC7B|nr:ABC transporter permease [Streptomyces sp. NBC_01217]
MSTIALRGPARVVVSQHRRALQLMAALPVLAVAVLAGTWLWTDHVADAFAATGCSVRHTVPGCVDTVNGFLDRQNWMKEVLDWSGLLMTVLPAFVGIFVAGPVIAREMESGTYKLAWSQSVTPTRWLAAKLAVPAVATLASVSVLSAVCAWARSRESVAHLPTERFDRTVYGSIGTVPVGYALCMLALGALIGLVLRRTVAAMAVTVIGYGVLVMTLNTMRNDLWPTVTDTFKPGSGYRFPDGSADVGQGWLTGSGGRLPADACLDRATDLEQCLADKDITLRYLDYHPASHFWPLQLVETGILLALAALAAALAFRALRHRHD